MMFWKYLILVLLVSGISQAVPSTLEERVATLETKVKKLEQQISGGAADKYACTAICDCLDYGGDKILDSTGTTRVVAWRKLKKACNSDCQEKDYILKRLDTNKPANFLWSSVCNRVR